MLPPSQSQEEQQQTDSDDELPLPVQESQEEYSRIPDAHLRELDQVPQSDDSFFDRYEGEPAFEPTARDQEVATEVFGDSNLAGASQEWGQKEEGADAPWAQEEEGADTEEESATLLNGTRQEAVDTEEESATSLNGTRQEDVEDVAARHTFDDDSPPLQEAPHHTEQEYEYQGDTGGLDDSMQESAEARLVGPETPAIETPALEQAWGSGEDWQFRQADDGVQASQSALGFETGSVTPVETIAHQEPQLPDTSTAIFSNDEDVLPSQSAHLAQDTAAPTDSSLAETETSREESRAVPLAAQSSTQDEWGGAEDDAFNFGADASANNIQEAAATEVNAPPAEDLADAWGDLLDDEEFLPDSDAAAAFQFDDEEGFLDESSQDTIMAGAASAAALGAGAAVITNRHKRSASTTKYTPANVPQAGLPPPSRTAGYAPDGPNFVDLSKQQQQPTSAARAPPVSPYGAAYQQPAQQRPAVQSAVSFADKAKGGYHSPYDLPDDLAVKRRRPAAHAQASAPAVQQMAHPPRLSSMQSMPTIGGPPPPKQQSPLTSAFPALQNPYDAQRAPAPVAKPLSRNGGFFQDLPVAPRPPRQATPSRTYSPAPLAQQAPPPLGPPAQIRPASTSYAPSQPPPQQQASLAPSNMPQLRPAERMPLYGEDLSQQRSTTMPPPQATRYSPAVPPSLSSRSSYSPAPPPQNGPANASRYSPAPGSGAKPPPHAIIRQPGDTAPPISRAQAQHYAPRTSSPLAQRETPNQVRTPPQTADIPPPAKVNFTKMGSASGLETVNENAEPTLSPPSRPEGPRQPPPPSSSQSSTPPPPRSQPGSQVSSPRRRTNYAPAASYAPMDAGMGVMPPRRSQTSSPSQAMKHPHLSLANIDRPASVAGLSSPIRTSFGAGVAIAKPQNRMVSSSLGGPAYHDMPNLVAPQDASVQDPLQRWKGAPVFAWGNGTTILTTFPRYTPTYGQSQGGPMIKPVPGDIKTYVLNTILPQSEIFLKFPGPLKKGKKKEVSAWLKSSIETLEVEHRNASLNGELSTALHTRSEERILLWKVMSLLVEHDGNLEGSPAVEAAVKSLLTSETIPDPVSATQEDLTSQPEAFDPLAVKALRSHLYAGEREKAVWHAVDQRLWAHALLIASTLNDKDIWKQVVQEFVRKEVRKSAGENTEALAALYQVFAGNWEESIDELVSVSARSGFQMVSTTGKGGEKDALAGLDRWRETLLLVLNNRSVGDAAALASLGNLLNGYGRAEAGHICFLFAKANVRFAGADSPESHFTLLGGHAATQGSDFGISLDTILLSEVYEFALSPSATPMPHLQIYKLYHAEVLAEAGRRSEAQQYCDAIMSIVTNKKAGSPYYNRQLLSWLDDFARRLSQAPTNSTEKSWKPSMDKVSSSIWGKFNHFIAGESETSDGSIVPGPIPQQQEQGFTPMAMPTLSRTASDIYPVGAGGGYTPFQNGAVVSPPSTATGVGSRYAPGTGATSYTPRSSSEQQRPKYAHQSQSAYEPRGSLESSPPNSYTPGGGMYASRIHSSYAPNHEKGMYAPADQDPGLHAGSTYAPQASNSGYLPNPPLDQSKHINGYAPSSSEADQQAQASGYGYEPPTSTYEPAPYQPYQPDEPRLSADNGQEQPRKKSFMDDDEEDDDLVAKAAALKKAQKGEADRVADEAFRKAVEADGTFDSCFLTEVTCTDTLM